MEQSNRNILVYASVVLLAGCVSVDPLFVAAKQGDTSQVETLLEGGRDPNGRDSDGMTPLLAAIRGGMSATISGSGSLTLTPIPGPGNADTVRVLLNHGADPNVVDKWGKSALMIAAMNDRELSVAALLARGADPNATNEFNQPPPLAMAASAGYLGVVKRLLEAGASVDAGDENGQTPLISASYNGHLQIVGVLLDAGADVNARNTKGGHTPLSNAAYQGQSEVVRLLIEHGARIDDKDDGGKDALAVARERGHTQVIAILAPGTVEPSIEAASADSEILDAVDAAVTVAKKHGFQYDDSDSKNGRVVVTALWKGRPVTLTMRYFRKMGSLYIASSLEQPGDVYLQRGGQKIEQAFYSDLVQETTRRGITVYGDPDTSP